MRAEREGRLRAATFSTLLTRLCAQPERAAIGEVTFQGATDLVDGVEPPSHRHRLPAGQESDADRHGTQSSATYRLLRTSATELASRFLAGTTMLV